METDRKIAASLPPPPQSAPPPNVDGSSSAFTRVRPMHGRTSGPTRRSTRGQWTPEEDEILCAAVQRFKGKNWKKIAECFKDRTDVQCLHRWQKVLNPDLIKGPWSKEEDEVIVQLVKKYGPKKWSTIAQHLPGRIGKQCRERWHNHLNPAINKEAWTQEEELVLIHAHDLYGNKWAELTKYLPGRTDNAIKNHWNSSVKKKLDSYKASGLLAQFQGLPLVSHQNQSMPAAGLLVQQSSGDGSYFRDGVEGEEISECSQVGCSQTASDMSNAGGQTRDDFIVSEESDQGKMRSTSPTASCSEQYYTSLDDMTFTISDIPCEFTCSSSYMEENYSKDLDSGARDCNFGAISLPMNSSANLASESCLQGNYYIEAPNHNVAPGPPHQSTEYSAPTLVNNCGTDTDVTGQLPRAEEGCSQIISTQEEDEANIKRCSEMIDMERFKDYISFQSMLQFSETSGAGGLQPYDPLSASGLEVSNCDDPSSIPAEISGQNGLTRGNNKLTQINNSSTAAQVQEFVSNAGEEYVHGQTNSSSPCPDPSDASFAEQTDLLDSSRSVYVNTFVSETSDDQQTHTPKVERPMLPTCQQEVGSLCYQPPRFPSLDIPFFSCDLAQSGTDAQQDFSPLGIRQLMMSSASSVTPFMLWDSPSSDDSPDSLLKSAAKSFACTPSILKKRHRDLLSPLSPFSERRYDKKTGNDVNQGFLCTSRLTKEFSRLDVIFDGTVQCKDLASTSNNPKEHMEAPIEEKENVCPGIEGPREDANHNQEFEARTPEHDTNFETKYEDGASETPRGVLLERHLNNAEFSSPDRIRHKVGLETGVKGVEADGLKQASKDAAISEPPFSNAGSFLSPPSFGHIKQNNGSAISSGQPVSAVTTVMVDSLVNEVGSENLNFFGGTPFRRSMESPSAWKSPWYFSSLVSCPRFEPDITIEDFGIFMSPGERSFDAIGLMKQINEQGADTYADAREVLGSETPESILKQRCSKNLILQGESSNVDDSQLEGSLMTSNVMTERRVLDFSECGTPAKSMEKTKCMGGASLSSPSCLLKSFR